MAYGLQTFKANGQISLDITDRILKLYLESTFTFTSQGTINASVYIPNAIPNPIYYSYNLPYRDISIPGIIPDGTFFCYIFPYDGIGNIASMDALYTIYNGYIRFYNTSYETNPVIKYKIFKG